MTRWDVPPHLLELEITERSMADPTRASQILRLQRALERATEQD